MEKIYWLTLPCGGGGVPTPFLPRQSHASLSTFPSQPRKAWSQAGLEICSMEGRVMGGSREGKDRIPSKGGVPNPQAADQYWSMALETSHTAGGERRAGERAKLHLY